MVAHPTVRIDGNMRKLVSILDQFLKIKSYASCSGHTKPSYRTGPLPKGEFYVSFAVPLDDPEGVVEDKLTIIRAAIRVYDGKVILKNDHETDGLSIRNGWCSWTIIGKDVNPDDLAGTLFSKYCIAACSKIPPNPISSGESDQNPLKEK